MATFTFDAIRIGYDADGLSNAFDIIEGSVLFFGDPTRIEYVFEADRSATLSVFGPQPGGPGDSPFPVRIKREVTFADGANADAMFFTIAEQDWATQTGLSGSTQAMYYRDTRTGTEYYIPLGGDPLPVSTPQDALALGFTPVGAPRAIAGPLGPGQDLLPELVFDDPDFAKLTRTEDDTIRLPVSVVTLAYGGAGNDTFIGRFGQSDAVFYTELSAAVEVKLHKGFAIKDSGGRDTLIYIDTVMGTRFDDTIIGKESIDRETNYLYGRNGDDTIRGRGEDDFIQGDDGDDRLFGASGADRLNGSAGVARIPCVAATEPIRCWAVRMRTV